MVMPVTDQPLMRRSVSSTGKEPLAIKSNDGRTWYRPLMRFATVVASCARAAKVNAVTLKLGMESLTRVCVLTEIETSTDGIVSSGAREPVGGKSGEESGTPSERVETGLGGRDQAVLSGHGVIKADRDGHRIGQGLRSLRRIDGAREVSARAPRQGREGTHSITCVWCQSLLGALRTIVRGGGNRTY